MRGARVEFTGQRLVTLAARTQHLEASFSLKTPESMALRWLVCALAACGTAFQAPAPLRPVALTQLRAAAERVEITLKGKTVRRRADGSKRREVSPGR